MLTTVTHAAISALYVFTTYYTFCVLDVPVLHDRFKDFDVGQLRFLTVWNVLAQTLFFPVCVLNDTFGTNDVGPKNRPLIRRFKDYLHAAIGFPVSMFVGLNFWVLMLIDRELVLPKALDPYFPWWLNHLMHTMVMLTTVLEMLMVPRKYPARSKGLGGLAGFILAYLAWMHFIHWKSGAWVYPVIEVLTWPLRIAFYLVLLVGATGLYYFGECLNRLVWKRTDVQSAG